MNLPTAVENESLPAPPAEVAPAGGETRQEGAGFWLYALHLWSVFAIALSNGLLGLALLSLPWSGRGRWQRLKRARPLLGAVGVYLLLFLVSILVSYDPRTSAPTVSTVFNLAPVALGLLFLADEKAVRRVLDGVALVAGVVAIDGLAQFLTGYGGIDQRIRGPFSHYMTFAGFLLVADVLLLAAVVAGGAGRSVWRWLALLAINAALLGSLTRSAWVGLAVALTLLLVLRTPRLLAAYLPLGALLVILAPVPVLQRIGSIFDLRDHSNYDRLCMADAGLQMIAERPLFGIGPDMVAQRYSIYRPPTAPRYQVPHLHNSFLEMAAERGLPSLAAYLLMMAISMRAAWRGYRREGGMRGSRADLYLGTFLALVAFNTAGLFENNWGDAEVQRLVLFVLVLPFCLSSPPHSILSVSTGSTREAR